MYDVWERIPTSFITSLSSWKKCRKGVNLAEVYEYFDKEKVPKEKSLNLLVRKCVANHCSPSVCTNHYDLLAKQKMENALVGAMLAKNDETKTMCLTAKSVTELQIHSRSSKRWAFMKMSLNRRIPNC